MFIFPLNNLVHKELTYTITEGGHDIIVITYGHDNPQCSQIRQNWHHENCRFSAIDKYVNKQCHNCLKWWLIMCTCIIVLCVLLFEKMTYHHLDHVLFTWAQLHKKALDIMIKTCLKIWRLKYPNTVIFSNVQYSMGCNDILTHVWKLPAHSTLALIILIRIWILSILFVSFTSNVRWYQFNVCG